MQTSCAAFDYDLARDAPGLPVCRQNFADRLGLLNGHSLQGFRNRGGNFGKGNSPRQKRFHRNLIGRVQNRSGRATGLLGGISQLQQREFGEIGRFKSPLQPVREPIEALLVRADGKLAYPVRDGIPIMLVEEALPL